MIKFILALRGTKELPKGQQSRYISALKEVRVAPRVLPGSWEVPRSQGASFYYYKISQKETNILYFDASNPLIGPVAGKAL